MGAYVTALKEGMEYLAEYEVDAKYETDERRRVVFFKGKVIEFEVMN